MYLYNFGRNNKCGIIFRLCAIYPRNISLQTFISKTLQKASPRMTDPGFPLRPTVWSQYKNNLFWRISKLTYLQAQVDPALLAIQMTAFS